MKRIAHSAARLSNRHDERGCAKTNNGSVKRTSVREAIAAALHEAFSTKTLTEYTGTGVRAAQNVFNGRNGLSLEAFIGALRSPAGAAILDAALTYDGSMPDWYERQQRLLKIVDLERQQDQAAKELKELKRRALSD